MHSGTFGNQSSLCINANPEREATVLFKLLNSFLYAQEDKYNETNMNSKNSLNFTEIIIINMQLLTL